MKLYKLECTNEDGDLETGGYYFNISNAEKAAKELDEIPINKQYGIVYHVVEIETDDSPSPSTPLKQLSDEEIKAKFKKIWSGLDPEYTSLASEDDALSWYSDGIKDSVSPLKEEKRLMAHEKDWDNKSDDVFNDYQSDHINPIELLEWATENYMPFINSNFKEWINRNEEDGFVLTTSQLIETFKNRK